MCGNAKNTANYLAVSKELPMFALRDRYNRYSKKTYQAGNTAYPLSTSASCGCSGLANLKGVRSFCIPIYKRIFDNNARPYQRFAAGAKCARRRRLVHETDESRKALQESAHRTLIGQYQEPYHTRGTLPCGCVYCRQVVQRRRVGRLRFHVRRADQTRRPPKHLQTTLNTNDHGNTEIQYKRDTDGNHRRGHEALFFQRFARRELVPRE
jgi:hypothetical protein